MFEWLSPYIQDNEFLSGGLVLMALGAAVAYCRQLPIKIWKFTIRQLSTSVELRSEDKIFDEFQRWAEDQPFIRKVRRVVATIVHGDRILTPAPGRHVFRYRSKIIFMNCDRNEESVSAYLPEKITLTFFPCRNQEYLRTFLGQIKKAIAQEDRFDVWINDKWFSARRRELSTVILPKNSDLMSDIQWFLDNHKWYDARGLDYKRGYLLYGPPGNGKTSLVRSIASTLKLPLQVINIRELTNDSALAAQMATSHPQVVLLEDLDCYALSHARLEKKEEQESSLSRNQVTMSGLLNAVDGVIQAEGRLLFITTNHRDKLDSALIRPGRIDRTIEIGNALPEQAEALYKRFHPRCSSGEATNFALAADGETSMAALQGVLIDKYLSHGGNGVKSTLH